MAPEPITSELVRAHFTYDPETGAFGRTDRSRLRRSTVGTVNKRKDTAYLVLCIDSRKVYAHRAAWLHVHGALSDGLVIDHIDGDGLNNRLSNLRAVTKAINQRNRRATRGRIVGVWPHRGGYSVHFASAYQGWTKDFFEACCLRKSLEAAGGYLVQGANQ